MTLYITVHVLLVPRLLLVYVTCIKDLGAWGTKTMYNLNNLAYLCSFRSFVDDDCPLVAKLWPRFLDTKLHPIAVIQW